LGAGHTKEAQIIHYGLHCAVGNFNITRLVFGFSFYVPYLSHCTAGCFFLSLQLGAGHAKEAQIIHYGLHCAVGNFKFTKYSFSGFDANACSGKTFGDPPVSAVIL